ncbi:MAG: DnaD domain protein [Erysipelotrichaceae bacterium]|nr:DnaD domain protein [Erysipelotrichaceae bacterium]
MNKSKFNKVIQDGNIVIPLYILKYFKKLNITMDEFIFLMYLYNKQDNLDFNPEKISLDLNIDIMEVMGYISTLTDKGYLNLQVKKTDNNLLEEVIDLSSFYEKISILLINNEEIETNNKGILSFVEKELARPISSLEIQMIEGWKNNNISDELIKEAIRLALNDGVYSLKYIDKILIDWKNHGYKDVNDVKNTKQDKQVEENINDDITDWDWLEDEEEYIAN